jgi:hypothetical protein
MGYDEISEYLLMNKLAVATDIAAAIHLQERAEFVFYTLKKAEADEKLMLLDFQWSILPIEQIKITCVSAREEKLFTYGF